MSVSGSGGSQEEMLEVLARHGYGPEGKPVTSATFVYQNDRGEMVVMEKRGRDTRPIDEGDTSYTAYVGAFMWADEWKLAMIGHAGGEGAVRRHNIIAANKALSGKLLEGDGVLARQGVSIR